MKFQALYSASFLPESTELDDLGQSVALKRRDGRLKDLWGYVVSNFSRLWSENKIQYYQLTLGIFEGMKNHQRWDL